MARTIRRSVLRGAAPLAAAVGSVAFGGAAHAALTLNDTRQSAAWVGTPTFVTGAAPTTNSGGTTNDMGGWGQSGSGVNGGGSAAEAFTVTTAGTLQNIQVVFTGGTASFTVSLYDLGPAASFNSNAGFPSVPAQVNFVPTTTSQAQADLLSAGDTFTYTANSTPDDLLVLTPSETVNLLANEVYGLAIDPSAANANTGSTWWVRGGVPDPNYSAGEGFATDSASYAYAYLNFEGHAGPYSSGGRNFDTAITVAVPEPASLGIIGLGAVALVRRRSSKV